MFHEGQSNPLGSTNSSVHRNGIFRLPSPVFRKDGNFLISFHVEGMDVEGVKPLYYPVRVDILDVQYGIGNACRRLRANVSKDKSNRQIASTIYDNIIQQFIGKYTNTNDFEALKHVMFTVYYSLPYGCLLDSTLSDTCNAFGCFTVAYGWNNIFDYVWRAEVATSMSSARFMECCLLLQLNVKKQYLRKDDLTLSALPYASEAIRCSSLSAVALRMFTLDQELLYDQSYETNATFRVECNIAENLTNIGSERPKRNIKRINSTLSHDSVDYNHFDDDYEEMEDVDDDSDF